MRAQGGGVYEEFEARAGGVRQILPRVDEMRPVHDLASLEALVGVLGRRPEPGFPDVR